MGSWEVVPNVFVIFLGPPGSRKSTTLRYAKALLKNIPNLTRSPDMITKEAILEAIIKSPDCAMSVMSSEFSQFIVKSGTDMYGFLTDIYDGQTDLSSSTRMRGLELAEEPVMNLLAATTPVWVAANMPEEVIGGGFSSRVIFIKADSVRRRQLFYTHLNQEFGETYFDDLKKDLTADLAHIALNLHGEFTIEPDAQEFAENWYRITAERDKNISHKLQGYVERRPAYVLKLAMILHVAYSDDLFICIEDIKEAISLLEQVEENLPETFQAVGKNPYTQDIRAIIAFVKAKGRAFERDIKREFRSAALPKVLKELLDDLVLSKDLNVGMDFSKPEDQRRYYFVK